MNLQNELNIKYPQDLILKLEEMVKINNPCFIYGNTGRSTFIKGVYPETFFIDSREILEIKSLGGFYAVKNNELVYIEGILTDAIRNGYKVCFQNIDFNINMLYYLKSVIDGKDFITTNGQVIKPHENFRIFFTCRDILSVRNVAFIGPIKFKYEDVMESFQNKRQSIEKVLNFIRENKNTQCLKDKGMDCDGICLKDEFPCDCDEYICNKHFRMLCEVRNMLNFSYPEIESNIFRTDLTQVFVNVFLKHESKILYEFLYITPLPMTLPNMLFAKTHSVESALKSLILNIKLRKPTLLVGETGAGKTALIQYLCSNSEYFFNMKSSLKIINMSSDFDSSDLLGGYQSVDLAAKIGDIYSKAKLKMPKSIQKRELVEFLIEKLKIITVKEKTHFDLLQESYLLLKLIDKKMPFFYKEGILVEAMKNGNWILIDEINLASEETLNLIESVLSKNEIILFDTGNFTSIKVHKNFMIFACMNPFGDYGKKKYDSTVFNKIVFYDFSSRLSCVKAVVQSITRNCISDDEKIANFYFEFKNCLNKKEFTNIVEPLVSGRTLCRALNLILQFKDDKSIIYKAFNLLFFTQLDFTSRSLALKLFKKHFNTVPTTGDLEDIKSISGFTVTPKVKIQMNDVDLAIKANIPVLLQGDTSTGKTSLITALATKYHRKVIRINNHNQTESSDYIGNYVSTKEGIRFNPGPLITAMKNGYWVILDELNLAPSDVLEILNRLLDDNKELYVPEMDETVKPHPHFRLFATQNLNYGGRHGLAKSFRNRFIEIFFYEKSESNIKEILEKSYLMPPSFTKYMLSIYFSLKTERSLNSFISLRDMFKWARRQPTSYYELFEIGLDIILERNRSIDDKDTVISVFRNIFQERFNFEKKNFQELYNNSNCYFIEKININEDSLGLYLEKNFPNFILTRSYIRLINLIYKAWNNYEPVLLIGETGIGKTKICEILSAIFKVDLKSINIHNGTESSDFIGHPVLDKGEINWKNGPLVDAMLDGNAFLIDEINLAEDSALERLNSVLEDSRSLFIPEISKEIKAEDSFRIIATMNPSGDFGKRELSPALRSRFTEIYFALEPDEYELIFDILVDKLKLSSEYSSFFKCQFRLLKDISIRKIEMICIHLKNIISNNSSISLDSNVYFKNSIYMIDKIITKEDMWNEVLEILGLSVSQEYLYTENDQLFGVSPYYLIKKNSVNFSFESKIARLNLQRIIRGITLNKGMLLQGEPGVGKTSMVLNLAKSVGIPVLRINLSDQTEMSDLVGSYLPQGSSIKFVESEMVRYIKSGYWIILDEINLCTQSVIEGLNSMLDHRKSIEVDGIQVKVNENTKIFGTMNPQTRGNGRKSFPKSFLDRFITITMDNYTNEDIKSILLKKYGISYLFDPKLSVRGNIKYNELELLKNTVFMNGNILSDQKAESKSSLIDLKTIYEFYSNKASFFGSTQFNISTVPTDYTIITSQIPQIELFLKCLIKGIPVILHGSLGRSALLRFVSNLFNLKLRTIDCHKDTDISDLLGQYQKSENDDSSTIFKWVDSLLIKSLCEQSLIVFNNPELIEKSVFDRLNSLFESEKSINVHEKGFETDVCAHKDSRLVLCCDNPHLLSPALIDRCISIKLSESLLYIDLYKIFISKFQNQNNENDKPFKFKSCFKDNLFADMIDSNTPVNVDDLDLEIKKSIYFKKLPTFIHKRIDILSTIDEDCILQMFSLSVQPVIELDRSHLEIYKDISKVSSKMPKSLVESLDFLIKNPTIPSLIKSLFHITKIDYFNCSNIPSDIYTLKISFLESLKFRTLEELNEVHYLSQNFNKVRSIESIEFDLNKFSTILTTQDPLNLIRNEILNEKISKENQIKEKISEVAKNLYKYGKGNLEVLLSELQDTMNCYSEMLRSIESRLKRDYKKFLAVIEQITLCEYLNNSDLRIFLEDFNDLSDYFLLNLFNNRNQCHKCHRISKDQIHSTKQCSLRLIRNIFAQTNFFEKLLKPEYSKYLFNQVHQINQSKNGLILEAICFNELESSLLSDSFCEHVVNSNNIAIDDCIDDQLSFTYNSTEYTYCPLKFTNQEIDDCIRNLIPQKTKAFVIDKRNYTISIGCDLLPIFDFKIEGENQLLPLDSIRKLGLFSSPEKIINEIQEVRLKNENSINLPLSDEATIFSNTVKKLDQLENNLKNLYKKESCLQYEKNYSYFQYLLFNELSIGTLENYFMNCLVYEFLDRISIAESFLKFKFSTVLYNSTLIFKSFEVEKKYNQKIHETRIKLFKEPRLYEQTISLFVDKFLYIPVLTVFKVNFEIPVNGFECACTKSNNKVSYTSSNFIYYSSIKQILDSLPEDECSCDCQKWIKLSKSINRNIIVSSFNQSVTKESLISSFYNRYPERMFSDSEIYLGKLINNVVFNMNSSKYDQDTLNACLNLCACAILMPIPSFIYFAFVFSNTFDEDENFEEGVGLKSGTGQNNMEDQEIHESDICDEFDDQKNDNIDSEGIDLNNEGDLHSVSDQDDAENDVDELNNEDGIKETEDDVERGEVGEKSNDDQVEFQENEEEESNIEVKGEENDEEIEESTEQSENEDISETGESSSMEIENSENSETDVSQDNRENNDLFSYEWKESSLNQNQTCAVSDSYNRKVEGGNLEEKDALKEGEGEEFVEGEGEIGKEGNLIAKSIKFQKISSDCTRLTNLLKIILESNKNNKYKGDFKSGKKLNLKKIVPYIASDFRKDKIWMKRTRNDKKDYIFRIFIDNSKSMYNQELIDELSAIYYKLESSLALLNIPVHLFKFGNSLKECTIEDLTFDEDRTVIDWTDNFTDGVNIILTDGIFQSVGYSKDNFLVLMIDKGNIKTMSKVNMIDNKVFVEKYLDSFALKYCVVQKIEDLEKAFIEALSSIIKDILN